MTLRIDQEPVKCFLLNTARSGPDGRLEAQFNPVELQEAASVNYARRDIPGLSHKPLQWRSTSNSVVNLNMVWDLRSFGDRNTGQQEFDAFRGRVERSRNFIKSLSLPRRGGSSFVTTLDPPDCVVTWPGVLRLTCKLTSYRLRYEVFALEGGAVMWESSLVFEEARVALISSEDAMFVGSERGPGDVLEETLGI